MFKIFPIASLLFLVTSCMCIDDSKRVGSNEETLGENEEVAMLLSDELKAKADVKRARANVKGIKDRSILGKVTFKKVPEGIKITADVDGLTPGLHGFHIHEMGDCSGDDGMAAGGHFDPTHSRHGGPDSAERHVGDLGNLEADAKGHAHYERVDALISFEGKRSILGRSIMIHEDRDDFVTQPSGASGKRIACGVIEATD